MDTMGKVLISEEQIKKRAAEIGAEIDRDFAGEEVLLVCILKGAIMWMVDVAKNIKKCGVRFDFMVVSSYGASTKSSGVVRILKDLDTDITNKNVIIVEDIVDSGTTLKYLKNYFEQRGPKSVKICTLLDKRLGRRVELEADYAGFPVDDLFIIGYGLDFDQLYRNLPYVSYLEGSEIDDLMHKDKSVREINE